MTFPRDIKDRVIQHPSRYKLVLVSGTTDTYDLVPVTGAVTEAGTPINKGYLQPIEDTVAFGAKRRLKRLGKDSEGLFVTLEWYRPDGTLSKRSVLSGGTSPKYLVRTVTGYALNGVTVAETQIYDLTYDADDMLIEEVPRP